MPLDQTTYSLGLRDPRLRREAKIVTLRGVLICVESESTKKSQNVLCQHITFFFLDQYLPNAERSTVDHQSDRAN